MQFTSAGNQRHPPDQSHIVIVIGHFLNPVSWIRIISGESADDNGEFCVKRQKSLVDQKGQS